MNNNSKPMLQIYLEDGIVSKLWKVGPLRVGIKRIVRAGKEQFLLRNIRRIDANEVKLVRNEWIAFSDWAKIIGCAIIKYDHEYIIIPPKKATKSQLIELRRRTAKLRRQIRNSKKR